MTAHLFPPVERHWTCPNCTTTKITKQAGPHTPMHPCSGLHGLEAPFVEDGVKADVRAVVREDYLNGDRQLTDANGRPIMSILRIREDGVDCWAQAASIHLKVEGLR